jgi:hypothetical protein
MSPVLLERAFSLVLGVAAGITATTGLLGGVIVVGDRVFGRDDLEPAVVRVAQPTEPAPPARATTPSSDVPTPPPPTPPAAPTPQSAAPTAPPPVEPSGPSSTRPQPATTPGATEPDSQPNTITLVDIYEADGFRLVALRVGDESHELGPGDEAVSPDGTTTYFLDAIEGNCARMYGGSTPFTLCRGQSVTL